LCLRAVISFSFFVIAYRFYNRFHRRKKRFYNKLVPYKIMFF
jgi:hypothetical protein